MTSHSNSFDITDKFKIGQYELASRLLSGVMNASLNADNKHPAVNDRLNSTVSNGTMSVVTCFSSGTDSESAAKVLSESFMIPTNMSLTGMVENDVRVTSGLAAVNVGSDASAVPDLIAATLPTKNLLNSLTVITEQSSVRTELNKNLFSVPH